MLQISPYISIPDTELDEQFVRASGPGGQNVNKVSTAVQLRFDVHASSLPDEIRTRLIALSGSRMTTDGVLVIDAREHRTQGQNRERGLAKMADLIRAALIPPIPRRKTKPSRGSVRRRLAEKKHQSAKKKDRGGRGD